MSERFSFSKTPLQGVSVITRQVHSDHRGWFERMFCLSDLNELLGPRTIQQINHTFTKQRGSVRGMHFQNAPHAEMKLISCLKGEVFDVAVDLRPNSPTYLQWHAEILSADNHKTMVIPEGFAHGFQCLSSDCELLYFHTTAYSPQSEGGVNPVDPAIAIDWPLSITELSERDKNHPFISKRHT